MYTPLGQPKPKRKVPWRWFIVALIVLIAGWQVWLRTRPLPEQVVTSGSTRWFVFDHNVVNQAVSKTGDKLFTSAGKASNTAIARVDFRKDGTGQIKASDHVVHFTWQAAEKFVFKLKLTDGPDAGQTQKWTLGKAQGKAQGQRYAGYGIAPGHYLLLHEKR